MKGEPQPSARDWIAIFGAILGAFMAVLDIQITNAALKDIQGGIAASLDEGTWISTGYLVAEIVTIPLSAWLAGIFSTKRYLIANCALFLVFSMLWVVRQPDNDGDLPRRPGLHWRRLHPASDDDRAALPAALEAADRAHPVWCHRDLRAGDRADDRRLADRHAVLALDLLHQPVPRHGHDVDDLVRAAQRTDAPGAAAPRRLAGDRLDGNRAGIADHRPRGGPAQGLVRQPDDR